MLSDCTAFNVTELLGGPLTSRFVYRELSGLFGTFLCDTERRRRRLKLKDKTVSIWTAVLNNKVFFKSENYVDTKDALWPSLSLTKVTRQTIIACVFVFVLIQQYDSIGEMESS